MPVWAWALVILGAVAVLAAAVYYGLVFWILKR